MYVIEEHETHCDTGVDLVKAEPSAAELTLTDDTDCNTDSAARSITSNSGEELNIVGEEVMLSTDLAVV